ncbi:MAG: hypothetical protein PQJ46_09840, partial [Spirochaetales bacterium]|nr:hypothetical protein [Spirochaetales bacterium]
DMGSSAKLYTGWDQDFAIADEGFFKVMDLKSNKIYYTRNGDLTKKQNEYYTGDGYLLLNKLNLQKEITIETQSYSIYTSDLFMPTDNAVVERSGIYFIFSSVKTISDGKVYSDKLEISSVNPIHTLLLMYNYIYYSDLDDKTKQYKKEMINMLINNLTLNKSLENIEESSRIIEQNTQNISCGREFYGIWNSRVFEKNMIVKNYLPFIQLD